MLLKALAIGKEELSLEDEIEKETSRCSDGTREVVCEEDFIEGRVVVLIDAMDEVRNVDDRKRLLEKILAFRLKRGKCRIVMTSREAYGIAEFARHLGAAHFRISDFSLKQATRIVDRVAEGRHVTKDQAKEILRKLETVHGVRLTPLLVTAFAATEGFASKDIPPNITEIFTKFTSLLLGQWDQDKGLNQAYEYRVKEQALKKIAMHMHSAQLLNIASDDYRSIVSAHMAHIGQQDKAEGLMEEIQRSGLILVDDEMRFRHPMIQEFYAGRAVEDPKFFEDKLDDDWWKNSLVFHFGEQADRVDRLAGLTTAAEKMSGRGLYHSAITIGTALQACYLSGESDRLDLLDWTVSALARGMEYVLSNIPTDQRFPLSYFVWEFLLAKDSVASDLMLKRVLQDDRVYREGSDSTTQKFWEYVGLLEAGHVAEAELLIKEFIPKEDKLLLAIRLQCYCIAHLKISCQTDKAIAIRIAETIAPTIAHYDREIMEEFKGYVLEMQQGQVKAIDAPLVTSDGQFEMLID